jgi:hypothetical protein
MRWKLMSNKPQPAEQSVLLDYVSPMQQPIVPISSARTRHWPVFTASVGSILITALTVISTSLFLIEQTMLKLDHVPMTFSSRINNTVFNQSLVDASLVLSALTLMSGRLSMAYHQDTNQQYATDIFRTFDDIDGLYH